MDAVHISDDIFREGVLHVVFPFGTLFPDDVSNKKQISSFQMAWLGIGGDDNDVNVDRSRIYKEEYHGDYGGIPF